MTQNKGKGFIGFKGKSEFQSRSRNTIFKFKNCLVKKKDKTSTVRRGFTTMQLPSSL